MFVLHLETCIRVPSSLVYLSTKRYGGQGKDRKEDSERKSKSTFHPSYSKSVSRIPRILHRLVFHFPSVSSLSMVPCIISCIIYIRIYIVYVYMLERGKPRGKRGHRTMRNDSCRAPTRFRPIDNFFQTRFTPTLREKCGEDTRNWSSG